MAEQDRFQHSCYVNWIKAGQALICTAEGIYDFCDVKINAYHRSLHQRFPRQPCDGICETQSMCSACASQHWNWRQDIRSQLTPDTSLCWTNSDTSKWDNDAWELAKVFMNPGQETSRVGEGDTVALVQLVLNCQLFASSISSRQSFEDVKEIRNKVFQSANFTVTNTELRDYIRAMTSALTDPSQLRNDVYANRAVQQLQQIETAPLQPNEQQVLQTERILWKQKFECISQNLSLSRQQVTNAIQFVSSHSALTRYLQVEISSLNARIESYPSSTTELQDQENELIALVARMGTMSDEPLQEPSTEDQMQLQQDQLTERVSEVEDLVGGKQLQQDQLTECLSEVEDLVGEPVRRLKQQFRSVHKRTIEDYLREKRDNENIIIDSLNDLYVELRVHDSEQYKRIEQRDDINSFEIQTDVSLCRQINLEDLFSPDPDSAISPLKVLVNGRAAIGKTSLAMRLLSMWLDGLLPPAIEHVFFFSMRKLSRIVGTCSLADLLFTHQGVQKPSSVTISNFLGDTSHCLFIMDGFEEFSQCPYEQDLVSFDYDTEVEISSLIGSIIYGKSMAMAKLVLTCRPGAHIEYHVFHRITEIYGFDEPRIHQYVSMFCHGNVPENVDLKSQIYDYIDSNINIRSFCYVPFFCNLICRIAKMKLEQTIEDPLPTTVTQLLTMSVRVLAIEHHPDFRGRTLDEEDDVITRIKDSLLHHCTLAKNGISCQPIQVLFSEEDIVSCGLSQDTAIKCGLLTSSREIHRQGLSVEERRLYSFLHLIVEEFLAGIVLLSDIHQTENLLRRTQHEGQLDMTLTFMSGLMGDQDNRDFLESLGYRTTTSVVQLLRLVVNRELENRRRDHKAIVLLLLILISESRQPELWAEIKAFVMADGNELDLSERHISPIEMQALIYIMPRMLDTFVLDMSSCSLKGTDLVAGLKGLTQLTHLRLGRNEDLHGLDVMTVLCSSLKEMINLEELDLSGCQLNDEDVFELSSVLITLRRLMEINLEANSIGDIGALRVTEVVCTLPRLTHLKLGYNWLTEDVIFLVRRTVHICFPRGLVQMLALDTQRPPGQEFTHPDLVVDCQWQVTNLEVGLRRLLSRPVVDREWYWAQEVVLMKGHLAVVQDWLRLAEDRRAAASEGHGDNLFYVIRGQQIQRRFRALEQDRPQ